MLLLNGASTESKPNTSTYSIAVDFSIYSSGKYPSKLYPSAADLLHIPCNTLEKDKSGVLVDTSATMLAVLYKKSSFSGTRPILKQVSLLSMYLLVLSKEQLLIINI